VTTLARYAVDAAATRGRRHPEPPPRRRSEFQRDRDRVIHCSAFRRLEYKTQVFVNHEGDMFRTRLTHSLEVAQIARSVARALAVNEDLTEAIILAYDLGHTPFGHAGQSALNECMRPHGGFEHNLQSLRVVDLLESRYPAFDGLNLLFDTREGILKHCSAENAARLGPLGERFQRRRQPSLEAQIANIADEIAYNHHDIDDGLRSGILTPETVLEHALFAEMVAATEAAWPALDGPRLRHTALRAMLGAFVDDLIDSSAGRLADLRPADVEAVRDQAGPLVDFSPALRSAHLALKRLLRQRLYEEPRVRRFAACAQDTVRALFEAYEADPGQLPAGMRREGETLARGIADYIAGMTDRFAIAEYRRLCCAGRPPGDDPWLAAFATVCPAHEG